MRWYGDDFDSRLSAAGLASVRVTPPALLGEAAVAWFRLMPHEVGLGRAPPATRRPRRCSPAAPARGSPPPSTRCSPTWRGRRARLAPGPRRSDRLVAQRDALRAQLAELHPAERAAVLTRLRRVARL